MDGANLQARRRDGRLRRRRGRAVLEEGRWDGLRIGAMSARGGGVGEREQHGAGDEEQATVQQRQAQANRAPRQAQPAPGSPTAAGRLVGLVAHAHGASDPVAGLGDGLDDRGVAEL